MSDIRWEKAEDTFLEHFCEIEKGKLFSTYLWKDGGNWGKFNFTRVYSETDSEKKLKSIINDVKNSFKEVDKTLSLKANFNLDRFDFLEEAGIPIVSMIIPRQESETKLERASFIKCKDHQSIVDWWTVNSDGRDRTGASPLFPVIEKIALADDNELFMIEKEGENVACGAISHYENSFNLWGLATCKAHQRQGYMKALINYVCDANDCKDFTVQVNLDSESWKYFDKIKGREVINTERRYIEK